LFIIFLYVNPQHRQVIFTDFLIFESLIRELNPGTMNRLHL